MPILDATHLNGTAEMLKPIISIPEWNASGVLPPVVSDELGNSSNYSPYIIELTDLIDRFSSSLPRIRILQGFLKFRSELHKLGVANGFHWLDGSFLENIEVIEKRPPNDLDVVTFFQLNGDSTQLSISTKNPNIFNAKHLKSIYQIDGYFVPLGKSTSVIEINKITYWYSLWAHRRDQLWKGFLQIDLDPTHDAAAYALLQHNAETLHE